jgi:hypothetical protein
MRHPPSHIVSATAAPIFLGVLLLTSNTEDVSKPPVSSIKRQFYIPFIESKYRDKILCTLEV